MLLFPTACTDRACRILRTLPAGPSRATVGPRKSFSRSPSGENFLFNIAQSGVLYIFERWRSWRGPQTLRGLCSLPPSSPSRRASLSD